MPEVIGRCPMCESELVVTHLRCHQCGTGLEGNFRLTRFDRLTREQLRFVDVFLRNRGVIRDVERELGISYPTVRSRLDEVISALGYDVAGEGEPEPAPWAGPARATTGASPDQRRQVLEQLAAGEITAHQAIEQLERLKFSGG